MAIGDGNKTPWSDIEKLSILFQIMDQVNTIDWEAITLPADRTLLGARKMIGKEKEKVKKAGGESPTKKRAASTKPEGESPEKKAKPKTPRKNAKKGKAASEGEDEDAEAEGVKAEPAEEEGDGFET
ncbi:hypothetical protein LTR56_005014 [Elasticomyces elasticus]|nr:hypothetical protein LTR22_022325 [Elasticomyces elasticus]KAK3652720.1 hypothetical protein LTR56_005014 [Elasticomyces elasticus]KAK4908373.1 hypothetical protein LTR49_022731 [Elasticomyces elasticus]KAK5748413.1 hypothetical protein LTS12_021541 [Elasticomyces elasticus]